MAKNSTTRGQSCARIANEVSKTLGWQPVSQRTVYRVLTESGYGVFKRTVKPGLTEEQKAARLQRCMIYKDQTIKDWKKVIFSDETSVQMGGVHSRRRVWRKKNETFHERVVARKWKGFSEFMQWSCFSYDEKGPYHIWEDETPAEKRSCKADLAARDAERYEKDKEEWEMACSIERLHVTRAQSGPRAQFKHTKKTGAYILNEGKGGVNQYQYQEKILKPLLLPFAKKCLEKRPRTDQPLLKS